MSEQQNIEWKQSWHDDYLKWVCGFANAVGGTVFIGKDNFGKVVHLPDYQLLMEIIPQKIRDLLGIVCEINLLEDETKKYIEIKVNPYSILNCPFGMKVLCPLVWIWKALKETTTPGPAIQK